MPDPLARPALQMGEMLAAVQAHGVEWVMGGSTVLAVYGADVTPNDLDVVPAPEAGNLRRLAGLLRDLAALPAYVAEWEQTPSLDYCRGWRPEPPTLERLDHLFVTRLGMLDVVPELAGTYAQLRRGATRLTLAGVPVWVCDPLEVMRHLPDPPRPKDRERAAMYAALRERLRTDRRPRGLARFGSGEADPRSGLAGF